MGLILYEIVVAILVGFKRLSLFLSVLSLFPSPSSFALTASCVRIHAHAHMHACTHTNTHAYIYCTIYSDYSEKVTMIRDDTSVPKKAYTDVSTPFQRKPTLMSLSSKESLH